uniref:Choline/ethanolamine kinase n=1 Tax=Aceria tosichella TaxID=561515 RepID=A0A6G1SFD7_9ACAR
MDLRSTTNGTDNELRNRAHKICCDYLGGAWTTISPRDMSFAPISGGMSNQLFCCSLPDQIKLANGEPSQALLRLYGDRNCDMTLQVQIFELLSKKDLGPKLYGSFDDGRLEEFLPASSLTCDELMNCDISSIIARKLATVHSLNVPHMEFNNTWLMDRFYEWLGFINEHKKQVDHYISRTITEQASKVAKKLLSIDFEKEINFLKQVFDGTRSPIVFSHNDLHQGNILLAKPSRRRSVLDKRVILIDFEYCSYNYRAYDIANHFCEWCFEYDTPDYPHFAIHPGRFPSIETQREFIRNYLDQQRRLLLNNGKMDTDKTAAENGQPLNGGNHATKLNNYTGIYLCDNNNRCTRSKVKDFQSNNNNNNNNNINTTTISNGINNNNNSINKNNNNNNNINNNNNTLVADDDYEIDKIMNEVKPFCMAANLVWTLWSIKSAHSSSIKFGYWEHAWTRWQCYLNFKRLYLKELEKGQSKRSANFIPKLNSTSAATARTIVDVEATR